MFYNSQKKMSDSSEDENTISADWVLVKEDKDDVQTAASEEQPAKKPDEPADTDSDEFSVISESEVVFTRYIIDKE